MWIFILRSVFPIRTAVPLSLHLTEPTGENGTMGSITSQTVACSRSSRHEAPTWEILNNNKGSSVVKRMKELLALYFH